MISQPFRQVIRDSSIIQSISASCDINIPISWHLDSFQSLDVLVRFAKLTRVERVRGIGPLYQVWKTRALPLSYTRIEALPRRSGRGAETRTRNLRLPRLRFWSECWDLNPGSRAPKARMLTTTPHSDKLRRAGAAGTRTLSRQRREIEPRPDTIIIQGSR